MDRRQILAWCLVASVLGGAACASKQGETSGALEGPSSPLARALAAARANGKAVLVVVAPDWPASTSALGDLFGDIFQNQGDDMYEDFALCEVVCATRRQIRDELRVEVLTESVGLVELDGARATWTDLPFDATALSDANEVIGSERGVRDRAEANHDVLRAALVANAEALDRRAEAVRRALGPAQTRAFLARLEAGETLKPEELDDRAALVRTHATWPATRPALIHAARERLLMGAPRGARWAASQGCGSTWIEFLASDGPNAQRELKRRARGFPQVFESTFQGFESASFDLPLLSPACGMAFTSTAGARFLLFYTDEN